MAYGKIKADAIIYDDSGSDVEKSLALLGTPEGTAIKSTGESGSAKYLRVDGDGTCSWQVPTDTNTQLSTEAVQDIVGAMVTGNTETGIAVTYEDGDGTLDFVVSTPTLATEATNVTAVANNSTDETVYPTFVDGATGTQGIETDTGLTYNPSTGLLTAVGLTLSGDLTVSGSTTTINTATLNVEDKNIELGKVSSPSDTTADGGGITLKGASDKTITWVDATDAWTFNQTIHALGSIHVNAELDFTTSGDKYIDSYLYTGSGTKHWMTFRTVDDQSNHETALRFQKDGPVELYHDNSKKIETTAAGVTVTGTVSDSKGDVRDIPTNSQSSAYEITSDDAGKIIYTSANVTLPASHNVSGGWNQYGGTVTIINRGTSDISIIPKAGQGMEFYIANDTTLYTTTRTLAPKGVITVVYTTSQLAWLSGSGIS